MHAMQCRLSPRVVNAFLIDAAISLRQNVAVFRRLAVVGRNVARHLPKQDVMSPTENLFTATLVWCFDEVLSPHAGAHYTLSPTKSCVRGRCCQHRRSTAPNSTCTAIGVSAIYSTIILSFNILVRLWILPGITVCNINQAISTLSLDLSWDEEHLDACSWSMTQLLMANDSISSGKVEPNPSRAYPLHIIIKFA